MADDKKIQEMTYADFMEYARQHGIDVERIDGAYVHVVMIADELPNNSSVQTKNPVRKSWADHSPGMMSTPTLEDAMVEGRKIGAIKIVRTNTGLGLKDSKDLVEGNWEEWCELMPGSIPAVASGRRV